MSVPRSSQGPSYLVVLELRQAVDECVPVVGDDPSNGEHDRPGGHPLGRGQAIHQVEGGGGVGMQPGTEHTVDPNEAIKRRSEIPLCDHVIYTQSVSRV